MKKAAVLFALLFFCLGISWTLAQEHIEFEPDYPISSTIGVLAGFYSMRDDVFREVYGRSAFLLGAEYTFRYPLKKQHGIDLAVSLRQLKKSGQTSYTKEETHLRLTTLSVSLRYSLELEKVTLFLGPGFDYFLYKERYAQTFPVNAVEGNKTGFHLTGGLYYHFLSSLVAKVYLTYHAAAMEGQGFRVNLGGTEWGLGVSYRFEF